MRQIFHNSSWDELLGAAAGRAYFPPVVREILD